MVYEYGAPEGADETALEGTALEEAAMGLTGVEEATDGVSSAGLDSLDGVVSTGVVATTGATGVVDLRYN